MYKRQTLDRLNDLWIVLKYLATGLSNFFNGINNLTWDEFYISAGSVVTVGAVGALTYGVTVGFIIDPVLTGTVIGSVIGGLAIIALLIKIIYDTTNDIDTSFFNIRNLGKKETWDNVGRRSLKMMSSFIEGIKGIGEGIGEGIGKGIGIFCNNFICLNNFFYDNLWAGTFFGERTADLSTMNSITAVSYTHLTLPTKRIV